MQFLNPQNLWRLDPTCKHEYLDEVQNRVTITGVNDDESEKCLKAQDCLRLWSIFKSGCFILESL